MFESKRRARRSVPYQSKATQPFRPSPPIFRIVGHRILVRVCRDMGFESISSLHNPRLKNLVRLRDGNHRRRQQRFRVEGRRELERALAAGWELEAVYFCADYFRDEADQALLEALADKAVELLQVSLEAFAKVAYRENPDGWLAGAPMRDGDLNAIVLSASPLLLVLESIEKPGNLGAMIRTANAAGADAVIVTDPVTDIYNPHAIRAAQGAFFDIPVIASDNSTLQDWLKRKEISPVLLTPHGDGQLWDMNLIKAVALVMGSEDLGLSQHWLGVNHYAKAALPMKGITDSLNVASTAAVALFEAVRQRR